MTGTDAGPTNLGPVNLIFIVRVGAMPHGGCSLRNETHDLDVGKTGISWLGPVGLTSGHAPDRSCTKAQQVVG
jgi:hypothetical protein